MLERINFQNISTDEICVCLSNEWEHMMTKQELMEKLDKESFQEINERILKIYLSHAKDIRKCPNSNWNFSGIIEMRAWKDKLQCDIWGTEWQDPLQVISYSKIF